MNGDSKIGPLSPKTDYLDGDVMPHLQFCHTFRALNGANCGGLGFQVQPQHNLWLKDRFCV